MICISFVLSYYVCIYHGIAQNDGILKDDVYDAPPHFEGTMLCNAKHFGEGLQNIGNSTVSKNIMNLSG